MKKENILGTEKIGKLIRLFSIPCIISMLVNSLYNIVDQIFIGQGVGMLGNGATNVVFPLTMIALALSLMFGDGASSFLSLKLGEKKKEEAAHGVYNGFLLCAVVSLLFAIGTLLFLPQLLNLFGCTDQLRSYAIGYGKIIALGLPFMMLGITLNSIIRADGSPKYSMLSMVFGAVLNIILDPIFIFVFHMGVEGAAWATIISQFVTFLMNLLYLKKLKNITLNHKARKYSFSVSKRVMMLGISSFITQMSFVFVASVANNLLGHYGAMTKYGAEIPITVLGIVMKVSQILNSIVLGLAIGAQPIFGYNYGAHKMDRVKQTLKIVLGVSFIITTIAFILFQTIPDKLILLFGQGDQYYMEFACLTFRIYLMLVICNGIQIPSGIFFQAIGKSSRSAILSLSRQIAFLLPAMFILSHLFGLMGVLYAGAVADGMAFILSSILLLLEIKSLDKEKNGEIVCASSREDKLVTHQKFVITISREYGSGGRFIGQKLASKLNVPCYDKQIVEKIAEETGFSIDYIEKNEQRRSKLDNLVRGYIDIQNIDALYIKEVDIIKELASKTSCVIIGRCADHILKDHENVIKIFIYNGMEEKIKRATKYYSLSKKEAVKTIESINKLRKNHYKHYTDKDWSDPSNYDICLNSDTLGVDKTVELLYEMIMKTK